MASDSSDYESENEYEVCPRASACAPCDIGIGLPFNPTSIEKIILIISDKFDFRLVLKNERTRNALLVTTGLTVAGSLLGKHYGGKIGAAVGGAIGGVCGIGIVAISMRDVWEDIKFKLSELIDVVYDYLAGMGLEDYKNVAVFLSQNGNTCQLAMLIAETVSSILGQKILSSITAA